MSMLTTQQEQVIAAKGCNLLVSAGAGAGKTHTLVERVIQLVTKDEAPVDVDSLLVVTFTNAAASEMRQRIAASIAEAMRNGKNGKRLRRQARLLNKASISTLHSFCLGIIRENYHRIGLDPSFRIADDLESEIMKKDVLERLFEAQYDREEAIFFELLECYGGQREDEPLQQIVLQLYRFASSMPWPKKWLTRISQIHFREDYTRIDDYPWASFLKDEILLGLKLAIKQIEQALQLALSPNGPAHLADNFKDDLSILEELLQAMKGNWSVLEEAFQSFRFGRLRSGKDFSGDEKIMERAKKLREEAKKIIADIQKGYLAQTEQEALSSMASAQPLVEGLVALVVDFIEAYQLYKREKRVLDFTDLEHYCLEILTEPDVEPACASIVAQGLQEKYSYVLVDEYQDINEVQETILRLVSRAEKDDPNLLMVGDAKQSIYRFRLAEPGLFQMKQRTYQDEQESKNRRVFLSKNFRSRQEIVDGVNYLFRQIMTADAAEMAYDKEAELICGASYPSLPETVDNQPEVILIDEETLALSFAAAEDDLVEPSIEEMETSHREAQVVAQRIHQLLAAGHPVYDKRIGSYRDVEFGDIVVLLRATKTWANAFVETFRMRGIPCYSELNTGYFAATEVNVMMALLRTIDNPRQDIPLAAVLRSSIVGMNADEMAQVRLMSEEGDYYDALLSAAKREETEIGKKCKIFIEDLEGWRTSARRGALSELLWSIYRETGYLDFVGCLPGGKQRQANLRALHDRARQYEQLSLRGCSRFLQFIETIIDQGKDFGEARSMGEKENVVRIMSIHKSKGLEFPVVFAAGLGKRFNMMDAGYDILLHKELGLGLEYVNLVERYKIPTLAKLAIKKKIQREQIAEEMRILYVALTRAKEKLFLVGSSKSTEQLLRRWEQVLLNEEWELPDYLTTRARNFLDWIIPALMRHEALEPWRKEYALHAGESILANEDVSRWYVKRVQAKDFLESKQRNEDEFSAKEYLRAMKQRKPLHTGSTEETGVASALSWRYAFEEASTIPSVITRPDLMQNLQTVREHIPFDPDVFSRSQRESFAVMEKHTREISSASYGNVFHKFMQFLDLGELKKELTLEKVKAQGTIMVSKGMLLAEEVDALSLDTIVDFFLSTVGQRMLAADRVKRELVFTLAVPAIEVAGQREKDLEKECVLTRGIIDCIFVEDGKAVLLDYKTDVIRQDQLEERSKQYSSQLHFYKRAVETIGKLPVKETYIYFSHLGAFVLV